RADRRHERGNAGGASNGGSEKTNLVTVGAPPRSIAGRAVRRGAAARRASARSAGRHPAHTRAPATEAHLAPSPGRQLLSTGALCTRFTRAGGCLVPGRWIGRGEAGQRATRLRYR